MNRTYHAIVLSPVPRGSPTRHDLESGPAPSQVQGLFPFVSDRSDSHVKRDRCFLVYKYVVSNHIVTQAGFYLKKIYIYRVIRIKSYFSYLENYLFLMSTYRLRIVVTRTIQISNKSVPRTNYHCLVSDMHTITIPKTPLYLFPLPWPWDPLPVLLQPQTLKCARRTLANLL